MNLVICGDSFMSADIHLPGTHFSELLTARGHSVTNLARGGISNTGIAFQLETAVQLKPDVVIFSSTSSDRIDIVVKNRKFDPGLGLKNFIYPYKSDSSTNSEYVGKLNAPILSDVIPAFLFPRSDLPAELQDPDRAELVKQYLSLLHDDQFKKVLDTWILGFWKYKLTEKQLPFIHLYKGGDLGQSMYEYASENPDKVRQSTYHTDAYTQVLMASELNSELEFVNLKE
jgi:hypothetical protein